MRPLADYFPNNIDIRSFAIYVDKSITRSPNLYFEDILANDYFFLFFFFFYIGPYRIQKKSFQWKDCIKPIYRFNNDVNKRNVMLDIPLSLNQYM